MSLVRRSLEIESMQTVTTPIASTEQLEHPQLFRSSSCAQLPANLGSCPRPTTPPIPTSLCSSTMSSRASSRAANRKGQGKQVSDAQSSPNSSGGGGACDDPDGSQKLSRRQKKQLAKADARTAEATTATQEKKQGKDQERRIRELEEQLKMAVATIQEMAAPSQGSQQWTWSDWSWWETDEPAAKWSRSSDWADSSWKQADWPATESAEDGSGIALNPSES